MTWIMYIQWNYHPENRNVSSHFISFSYFYFFFWWTNHDLYFFFLHHHIKDWLDSIEFTRYFLFLIFRFNTNSDFHTLWMYFVSTELKLRISLCICLIKHSLYRKLFKGFEAPYSRKVYASQELSSTRILDLHLWLH